MNQTQDKEELPHTTSGCESLPDSESPSLSNPCRINGELPLITSESLPESPSLFNPRRINGPVVHFLVLAFPLPMATLERWADVNQVAVGREPHVKRDRAWKVIHRKLPAALRRAALVPVEGVGICPSVVVGTNKSSEDLKTAEDLSVIHTIQRVLGTTEPPAWYLPERD